MNKSTFIFTRTYNYRSGGGERGRFIDHNAIDRELAKMYFTLRSPPQDGVFLYYDRVHLVKITSINQPTDHEVYERRVVLEVMPPTSDVPDGLAKLLSDNKFNLVPPQV